MTVNIATICVDAQISRVRGIVPLNGVLSRLVNVCEWGYPPRWNHVLLAFLESLELDVVFSFEEVRQSIERDLSIVVSRCKKLHIEGCGSYLHSRLEGGLFDLL